MPDMEQEDDPKAVAQLHQAILDGDECKVQDLIKPSSCCWKMPTSIEARQEGTKNTPLITAAVRGDQGVVRILLARDANVHAADVKGQTALHHAAVHQQCDTKVIDLLLRSGADLEARAQDGLTPLLRGIAHRTTKQADPLAFLLARGADPKATTPEGLTALLLAVVHHRLAVVKVLVAEKEEDEHVDEERDPQGRTALMLAAMQGDKEIVALLLAKGADPEAQDDKGDTAAKHAAELGHTDVLEVLGGKAEAATAATAASPAPPTPTLTPRTNSAAAPVAVVPTPRTLSWSEKYRLARAASLTASASSKTEEQPQTEPSTPLLAKQEEEEDKEEETATAVATPSLATPVTATSGRRAGPPVLPSKPEVRKEKADPRLPSILVPFAPAADGPQSRLGGALKYVAEAYLLPSPQQEGGEIGVEEYKGERSPQGDTKPVAVLKGLSSSQTPFVFQGLARAQWYVFRVYSESVSGGWMSAPSLSEPVFLATAPTTAPPVTEVAAVEVDGVVDEEGQGTVRVTLAAPADDGGSPITSYVLNAKPGGLKFESESNVLLLPGLTKGRSYKISVAARNAAGQGPFSKVLDFDFKV